MVIFYGRRTSGNLCWVAIFPVSKQDTSFHHPANPVTGWQAQVSQSSHLRKACWRIGLRVGSTGQWWRCETDPVFLGQSFFKHLSRVSCWKQNKSIPFNQTDGTLGTGIYKRIVLVKKRGQMVALQTTGLMIHILPLDNQPQCIVVTLGCPTTWRGSTAEEPGPQRRMEEGGT